jgi:uncharacterized protein (DUF1330 family)
MQSMPKAYWVAQVDVKDPDAYLAYIRANAQPFEEFGAKFIVRGGPFDQVEGKSRARIIVIEFPDLATARACYNSPGYQAAKALREPVSEADVVIIEGYAP